jgi:hypothetical protein
LKTDKRWKGKYILAESSPLRDDEASEGKYSDSAQRVLALFSGFPNWRRRLMGVLQVVVDDSGRGQSTLVLGGCIATVDEWIAFTEQWKRVLDEPPAIEYFKMREAHGLSGQFEKFGETERDIKVWRLVSVLMMMRDVRGVRVIVDLSAYRRYFTGQIAKGMDYPTFLASHEVVHAVMRGQLDGKLPKDGPAKFVFDEQGKESDMFLYSWSENMPRPADAKMNAVVPPRPVIEDDKTFLPLQAADLFAWHYANELSVKKQNRESDSPFWSAIKTFPVIHSELGEERLSKLITGTHVFADKEGMIFEYQLSSKMKKMIRKEMAQRKAEGRSGRGKK